MRVFPQPEGPVDLSAGKVPEATEWGADGRRIAIGETHSIPLCGRLRKKGRTPRIHPLTGRIGVAIWGNDLMIDFDEFRELM